ncbi:MAG: TetR family transcriptional regulator [Pseudomonadota bacterium]
MEDRANTPNRILDAARALFNQKGYAATTMAEIAKSIGISPGNLTYHFPSKRDLVVGLRARTQAAMDARWRAKVAGAIADDYIEHLLFAIRLTWDIRFLLQDHALLSDAGDSLENSPYMLSDYEELTELLQRIEAEGLFRKELSLDIEVLSSALWMNSRYWMDHLRELGTATGAPWQDLEAGIRHHITLLGQFLKPKAKSEFESAMESALRFMKSFNYDAASGTIPQIA